MNITVKELKKVFETLEEKNLAKNLRREISDALETLDVELSFLKNLNTCEKSLDITSAFIMDAYQQHLLYKEDGIINTVKDAKENINSPAYYANMDTLSSLWKELLNTGEFDPLTQAEINGLKKEIFALLLHRTSAKECEIYWQKSQDINTLDRHLILFGFSRKKIHSPHTHPKLLEMWEKHPVSL